MRHDHTKWITHFVRDRIPDQDFPGATEDEIYWLQGGELEPDARAFSVLKAIVRLGGITPGYSFRNGRTTIYGGSPAVCATEMPLYSFAQYAQARTDSAKVSAYGIAFLKSEFYTAGGRPAIYGLSTEWPSFKIDTPEVRIFEDSILPQSEQYRYVAYNPSNTGHWVDWSHEREWRWIPQDPDTDTIWVRDYTGAYGPTPALPLFAGLPFTRVCIIVWTQDEANKIREILTGLYLAGSNNYDTPFDKQLISASKIIVLQTVVDAVEKNGHLASQTIEGLAQANLLEPITIPPPPANAAFIVQTAFARAEQAAKEAATAFIAKYGEGSAFCGFAHATTTEVTHPIVQYMLSNGHASGPFDGRVWINFQTPSPPSQSMDYNEEVCRAAADELSDALGIYVWCESRPD